MRISLVLGKGLELSVETRGEERIELAKVNTTRKAHRETDKTWGIYQDIEFWAGHELNQPGQHPHVNHLANALDAALGEVGQSPAGVREHLVVLVLQELGEDGQHLLHRFFAGVRVLVSAQVGQGPCDVPQKCNL